MKELSKEMQMVYDFCKRQMDNLDNAETDNFTMTMQITAMSNSYWSVLQFIEVNFMEDGE